MTPRSPGTQPQLETNTANSSTTAKHNNRTGLPSTPDRALVWAVVVSLPQVDRPGCLTNLALA